MNNQNNRKAVFNWSGGKDSAFALWEIMRQNEFAVETLLTNVNKRFDRISMHGVRSNLLKKQAGSIGLPLEILSVPEQPTMETYDKLMASKLLSLKKRGIEYAVFGDIFLEDLKKYREQRLLEVGLQAVFPLWKMNTLEIVNRFMEIGFKAIVVSVNSRLLDKSFAGRVIDEHFLDDLPKEVDPCGENGEFHSFVFDGHLFNKPVSFTVGKTVLREYKTDNNWDSAFWYCDLK